VLLSDIAGRDVGGYQCLPHIYQNLSAWLDENAQREDFDFFNPGLTRWTTTQIEGRAGDIILWSSRLPHGTAANLSARPRIAVFVSMQPPADDAELKASMKRWWMTKQAPDYWRGMAGQVDPEPGEPAALSHLGLQLIGALPWD